MKHVLAHQTLCLVDGSLHPPPHPPPPSPLQEAPQCRVKCVSSLQSALRDAAKQDDKQGVVAIAKKANDLYRQQQEIQKRADQRYTNSLCYACCAIKGHHLVVQVHWAKLIREASGVDLGRQAMGMGMGVSNKVRVDETAAESKQAWHNLCCYKKLTSDGFLVCSVMQSSGCSITMTMPIFISSTSTQGKTGHKEGFGTTHADSMGSILAPPNLLCLNLGGKVLHSRAQRG